MYSPEPGMAKYNYFLDEYLIKNCSNNYLYQLLCILYFLYSIQRPDKLIFVYGENPACEAEKQDL
jgi:hypothetical protein